MYNESLTSGICPTAAKKSTVTPIQKVPNSNKIEDNRPINSIPVFDKMMQIYVKNELESHVDRNCIYHEAQSGYRKLHNCETAINFVLARWKVLLEQGKIIIVVFYDLKRAFETVDREILIKKLKKYGVDGKVLMWLQSWLTDRKQETRFNAKLSSESNIEDGIPQGTPLACILFALYINDLPLCAKNAVIKMFCDDTMAWVAEDNFDTAKTKIEEDMIEIENYLKRNKLKLNVNKTKFMVIGSNRECILKMDGIEIEKVDTMKYLGVVIDEKLNFKENIEYLRKKMTKKVSFMMRMKKRFDQDTKLLLYKTLVMPHLDYCSSILFLNNDTDLKMLQKQQNRALRTILNADRMTNIRSMLDRLDLMDVKQRIVYNVLMLIYKMEFGLLPDYLCRMLKKIGDTQNYALRSNENYRLPNTVTAKGQNQLLYKGVKLYNELKERRLVNQNIEIFKNNLKQFVKENVKLV